ncbi:MAG: ferritin family protein [Spirochaetes bacterium]|nr:ferritin family protein [Spirochaetota bacterium]
MEENLLAIFDFAIREEEGAKLLYTHAAGLTEDMLASHLLNELAGIEEEHAEKLRHFRDGHSADPGASIAGPALKLADYRVEGAPGPHSRLEEILSFAVHSEDRSYKLYSELADRFSIPEGAQLLRELAAEELQHKNHLSSLYRTAFAK